MIFFIIKFVIRTLIGVVVILLALGFARTWQTKHSASQTVFLAGTIPSPAPDGLYNGNVPGYVTSWLGKKFDATSNTGTNVFKDSTGVMTEKYPFKTYSGKSVTDTQTDVLKIDYDSPQNPFWLRPVVDEIVQISPQTFLGKLQMRIIPNYPFTLLFFELRK